MKRRKFLGLLGGAMAAPVVVKVAEALPAVEVSEILAVPDQVGGVIAGTDPPKLIWPGLDKLVKGAYEDMPLVAQQKCDQYAEWRFVADRDQYVSDYFGHNP